MRLLFILIVLIPILNSCETEWDDMPTTFDGPELVIEGYVEYNEGGFSLPPYVILTESSPYLATLDLEAIGDLFVKDADVRLSDGSSEISLTELCISDIPNFGIDTAILESVAQFIGIGSAEDLQNLEACIYIDLAGLLGLSPIEVIEGGTYNLSVVAQDGRTATATTTIPELVELDSIYYDDHPDFPDNDTLVQVYIQFTDPANQVNYYRVFTQQNNEIMYPQGFAASVSDDKIVNGQTFEFPISRGQPITSEFDVNTFGYFWRGDTVTVRFASLDYEHFRFWQTSEYNTGQQGPFSSYVRIEDNIEGGLGIWGGISYRDYTIITE